jgi:hypothetical protein
MTSIVVEESRHLKQASARFREGAILIRLPKHWPSALKKTSVQALVSKVERQLEKREQEEAAYRQLLENPVETLLTFSTPEQLTAHVLQINAETLNQPVAGVRIGAARFSRLAQINLKTRIITISRFCLERVPEKALRYLIIHELVHLLERGHNRRFWGLVALYMPDYRVHAKRIMLHHRMASNP